MRPINKGTCPQLNGANKVVTDYRNWRRDLIDRIGYFCVYCNMPLSEQLQVEHVIPKNPIPGAPAGAPLDWNNMVLACGPCNRTKSNHTTNSIIHYLPESHNSHLPFSIVQDPLNSKSAIVIARVGINAIQLAKAGITIDFFNLDVYDERDAIVDLRWLRRKDAMTAVESVHGLYNMGKPFSTPQDAVSAAKQVAVLASHVGFFSLWYDKFHNEPNVMEALTNNTVIKGTESLCFDAANGFKPIPKNPLNIPDTF